MTVSDRCFDKIFTIRVGLFHHDPERARGIVGRWLARGGALFVFYDQPSRPDASRRPRLEKPTNRRQENP